MEQKFNRPLLFATLLFVVISIGNIARLKGIENIKTIYIVSLLIGGIGIGAFIVSMIVFLRNKKK